MQTDESTESSPAPRTGEALRAEVTDAKPSERSYYRDHKQVKREIWQPGDGDGVYLAECYGSPVTGKRYRFFQSPIGLITRAAEPPKYVILDDLAVYEILQSSFYSRPQRAKFWSHDFGAAHGNVRTDRPNRGRPALLSLKDTTRYGHEQPNKDKVASVQAGEQKRKAQYSLFGEKGGYTAIEFQPQASASPAATGSYQNTAPTTQLLNRTGRRKAEGSSSTAASTLRSQIHGKLGHSHNTGLALSLIHI